MAATSYKLSYFNGRGLAETSRLIFAHKGVAFEDNRFSFAMVDGAVVRPEFEAAKAAGELPMDQVPVLTVTKGGATTKIVQSKAVERYLARTHGLMGASDEEAGLIDGVGELLVDLRTKLGAAKDDAAKAAYINETLPAGVRYLNNYLAKSGSGFLVGANLSLADIQLYSYLTHSIDSRWVAVDLRDASRAAFDKSEGVKALLARIAADAGIAAWEAGRAGRNEAF